MQYILTHHVVEDDETQETLLSIVFLAVALQGSSSKTAHIKLYLVTPQQDALFKKNFLLVAMNHPVAQQETYVSEVVIVHKKGGSNSAAKDIGVPLLQTDIHGLHHGVYQMQWLFVGSLGMLGNVSATRYRIFYVYLSNIYIKGLLLREMVYLAEVTPVMLLGIFAALAQNSI